MATALAQRPHDEAPVFVVGAGPSGLAAAWRLSRAGRSVVVLEARDRVGGQLCTIKENGFLMESGTVILPEAYESVMNLVREAGLLDELVPTAQTIGYARDDKIHYIRSNRMLFDALRSRLISWRSKLRLTPLVIDNLRLNKLLSYEDLSLAAKFDTETPAEYCKRRGLGDEIYDYVIDPTIRGSLGTRGDRISLVEFFFVINKILGTTLYAFREGYSTFPERLASKLDVRLNCRVQEVVEVGGGVRIAWQTADGQAHTAVGSGCIVTAFGNAVPDLVPQLDPECSTFLRSLKFTTCVNVNFALSRPPAEVPASVVVVPRPMSEGVFGMVLSHNQVPGRVPEGKGLVCAYSTNEWGEAHADEDDESIVRHFLPVADRLFPGFPDDIEFLRVHRWYPVLAYSRPGLYRELGVFNARRPRHGRIHLAGSYFSSSCVNTATVAGERAARELIEAVGVALTPTASVLAASGGQ